MSKQPDKSESKDTDRWNVQDEDFDKETHN